MPKKSRHDAKTWTAITLDYNYISSLPDDIFACYKLSIRQSIALASIADYLGFVPRYDNPAIDIRQFASNLRDGAIMGLLNPMPCDNSNCTFFSYGWEGKISYNPPRSNIWEGLPISAWNESDGSIYADNYLPLYPVQEISFDILSGEDVDIHLQTIIMGGMAQIIIDGIHNQFVDLNADVLGVPPELPSEIIVEYDKTESDRNFTIRFLPRLNDELVVVGFGGGFNGLTICNGRGETMPYELRQSDNPCILEQSNDGGETWKIAYDYSLCKAEAAPETIQRYNPLDNLIEQSSDNGETWKPSDNQPNKAPSAFAKPIGIDKWTAACYAASNIKFMCIAWLNSLDNTEDFSRILREFQENFWFLPFGSSSVIGLWVGYMAVVMKQYGAVALRLLLEVQAIWNAVACHVFCALNDDLSIKNGGARAVASRVFAENVPVVGNVVGGIIQFIGDGGLSNAAYVPSEITAFPSTPDDCDDCTGYFCAMWNVESELQFVTSAFVTIDEVGVPFNTFVWNGTTFHEWKVACGIPQRYISDVICTFESSFPSQGISGAVWDSNVNPSGIVPDMPLNVSGSVVTIPCNRFYDHLSIALVTSNYGGHIIKVEIRGEGANPYGSDNCQ